MIDLSRKNFEEYYNDWGGFGCQYCLHHRMGDSYNIPDIAKAWRHWQASRECLVIELPKEDDSGKIRWTAAMRSIESAGAKVKP